MHLLSLKKTFFVLLCITITFVYSCTNRKADEDLPRPDPPPGTDCDTANLSFSADIMPIFQQYCATSGCHTAATRAGGYAYTNHEGIMRAVRNGRLLGSINHQAGYVPMPQNAPKLSDCDITKITHWIETGTPDN